MKRIIDYINESKKQILTTATQRLSNNDTTGYNGVDKILYDNYGIHIADIKKFVNKNIIPYLSIDVNRMVIDIWTSGNYFYCTFSNYTPSSSQQSIDENDLIRITCNVKYNAKYNIYEFYDFSDRINNNKTFAKQIEKEFNDLNRKVIIKYFNKLCKIANIKPKQNNTVEIIHYVDNKENDTSDLIGKLDNIFSKYTTLNDKLKYVNGTYYKFKNPDVETLYHFYVKYIYEGNYFLDNAVKRGVTID